MALRLKNSISYSELVADSGHFNGDVYRKTLTKLNSDSQRDQLLVNFWAQFSGDFTTGGAYNSYRSAYSAQTYYYAISSSSTLYDYNTANSPTPGAFDSYYTRPGITVDYHRDSTTGKLGIRFVWISQFMSEVSAGASYLYNKTTTVVWEENTAHSFNIKDWHNIYLAIDAKNITYNIKIDGLSATDLGFTATESIVNAAPGSGGAFATSKLLANPVLGAIAQESFKAILTDNDIAGWSSYARHWTGWASTYAGLPPVGSFVSGTGTSLTYPNYKISADGTEATTSIRALAYHHQIEPNGISETINRGSAGTDWNYINSQYNSAWTLETLKPEYQSDEPGTYTLYDVVFGKFVEEDYVANGYVSDGTIYADSILAIATINRVIFGSATLGAIFTANGTASTKVSISATLTSAFTVDTLAYKVQPGSATLTSNVTVSSTAMRFAGGIANLQSTATIVSSYAQLHLAQVALTTTTTTVIAPSLYLGASANLQAFATTLTVSTGIQYAQANLTSVFTTNQTPGYLLDVKNDVVSYTWDSLIEWDRFENSSWSINGIALVANGGVVTLAGDKEYAQAALTSNFALTAAGTTVTFATASLTATATVAVTGGIFKDAICNVTAVSTLTALGLRVQEIYTTMFGAISLTTLANVKATGSVDFVASASLTTNPGIIFGTTYANLESAFNTNIFAGSVFNTGAILYSEFAVPYAVVTISTYETYRTYKIPFDARAINVYAQPRTIVVPQNTRVIHIPVPALIQPTKERQL